MHSANAQLCLFQPRSDPGYEVACILGSAQCSRNNNSRYPTYSSSDGVNWLATK